MNPSDCDPKTWKRGNGIEQDNERLDWIGAALRGGDLDALVCTLPENVLLLSGYWPVVGTSVAVATRDGRTTVLAPEDENDLTQHSFAAEVRTYQAGSLSELIGPAEAIREPLQALIADLGLHGGRIGFEDRCMYEAASYAAMFLFGASIYDLLRRASPYASLQSGLPCISQLRSRLTSREVDRVRQACKVAGKVFTGASPEIRPMMNEPQVAISFAGWLEVAGLALSGTQRAGGFVWCMSGPNSALAGAAYARTRDRRILPGDLVLVHSNSFLDGYWTDITRTYVMGEPDERQRAIFDAIFVAREAALAAIFPGARAVDVDAAARRVLTERGFGEHFTHGIGHNVGFSVISAEFPPRLHPASPDHLSVGMTFNIEPAVYIKGYGGIRHCDVVTVREDGPEVLTPFQAALDQLILGP